MDLKAVTKLATELADLYDKFELTEYKQSAVRVQSDMLRNPDFLRDDGNVRLFVRELANNLGRGNNHAKAFAAQLLELLKNDDNKQGK